ncbi:MAG: hypothetical protein F2840_16205 [Actinobacteria bacterium]|uniref:Unannotated protein n=1 Tax=freshwater metagenome TaxID=449393 RepID=A0A6J7LN02_9ZZZZ|nr:hypothetical protein [Actinomycetota bacterium]
MPSSRSALPGGSTLGRDDGDGIRLQDIESSARVAVERTDAGSRRNRWLIGHSSGCPASDASIEAGASDRVLFDRWNAADSIETFVLPVEGRTTLDVLRAPGCAPNWVKT